MTAILVDSIGVAGEQLEDPWMITDREAQITKPLTVIRIARGERQLSKQPYGPLQDGIVRSITEVPLGCVGRRRRYPGDVSPIPQQRNNLLPLFGLRKRAEPDVTHSNEPMIEKARSTCRNAQNTPCESQFERREEYCAAPERVLPGLAHAALSLL